MLSKRKLARLAGLGALLQLTLLSLASNKPLAEAASSYLDDYFLPTAKIALNKIQQSLAPTTPMIAGTNKPPPMQMGERRPETQEIEATTADQTDGGGQRGAPNSVVFDLGSRTEVDTAAAPPQSERPTTDVLVASSTESVSEDPTAASAEPAEEAVQAANAQSGATNETRAQPDKAASLPPVESASPASTNPADDVTQAATTTPGRAAGSEEQLVVSEIVNWDATSSSGSSSSSSASQSPSGATVGTTVGSRSEFASTTTESNSIGSAKNDETVRETELAAIAAVDASIGFGDSLIAGTADACYDEYGNARFCEPEFENIALERSVEVSSECGRPPSRFCTSSQQSERHDQVRNCHICDAQHPKKRHPASFLTDAHNSAGPTCWVSAPISATAAAPIAPAPSGQQQGVAPQAIQRDNVTLSLNFEKRFEVTYVSLHFCSLKPDSLAIWKSNDFGSSWQPFQFYSSQCAALYNLPAAGGSGARASSETGRLEAGCASSVQVPGASAGLASGSAAASLAAARVAFSTLDEASGGARNGSLAAAANPADKTQALHDWMSATNIRIVLDRHQASWVQASLAGHAHNHHQSRGLRAAANGSLAATAASNSQQGAGSAQTEPESSLTNPSDTYNYALADVAVGGRCKCNGHAARCVHSLEGKLQCDCQHNTDGPDCERCLPLHHDRPWQRATQASANPCQPCDCNGHSRKCRFDAELYLLSGKRSGGVCIDCKDNTTGRHCNYCKEGFTRDHSRPMSDQAACKPCDCHPVGSLGKVCNHTTGQCPCKEGVTGLECNRCAPGYQQSSSPSEPCIRLPENDINYEPMIEANEEQPSSVSHQLSGDQEPGFSAGMDSEQSTRGSDGTAETAATRPHRPNEVETGLETGQTGNSIGTDPADEQSHSRQLDEQLDQGPAPSRQVPGAHRPRPKPARRPQADAGPSQWRNGYHPASRFDQHQRGGGKYRFRKPARPQDEYDNEFGEFAQPRQLDQDEYDPATSHGYNYYSNKRLSNGNDGNGYASDYRQRIRPLASLDNEQLEDETSGIGGRDFGPVAPDSPMSGGSAYASTDETGFNQIPRHNNHHAGHQLNHPHGRTRLQSQGRFRPLDQAQYKQRGWHGHFATPAKAPSAQGLNCADCPSRIKKLNPKQFCHLDYAIRATVMARKMSSDWTRIEVEIQDIFKSATLTPTTNLVADAIEKGLPPPSRTSFNGAAADLTLEEGASTQADNQTARAIGGSADGQAAGVSPLHHRLKVGMREMIWVPTEDVDCKCPRLKLHSTYLLMGLVDARENSATAIQLDRHGVALVWRASLQERLIKYQRLRSEGLC